MKKVKLNNLSLNDTYKLSSADKRKITGGASGQPMTLCKCDDGAPMWYIGCDCPSSLICVAMSMSPPECMGGLM